MRELSRSDDRLWTDEQILAKVGKDKVGSYNVAPWGWRPITEKEFVQGMFHTYSPVATEFRQVFRDIDGNEFAQYLAVKLFWFHDGTGVAMHCDYWKGRVDYFAFGCNHEYVGVSPEECKKYTTMAHWGMHCRAERCVKCDDFFMVDTSG